MSNVICVPNHPARFEHAPAMRLPILVHMLSYNLHR